MADVNSSNAEPQPGSYADYIDSIDDREKDKWLANFLRRGYEKRYWQHKEPSIEIYILDSVNDSLECETFVAPRQGAVSQAFLDTLRSQSLERHTRLILLQCGQLGDTNGCYIDAIGRHYMPDPAFFSAHYDLCRDLTEPLRFDYPPALLPSERQFVQIITDSNIIVVGSDHILDRRITNLRDELLKISDPAEVRKLDDSPADYLYPYIRDSARAAASVCTRHAHYGTDSIRGKRVTPFSWEWNQSNCRALISSMNSLQRFVTFAEVNSGAGSLRLQKLLPDYAALIEETAIIGSDVQGLLQQQANLAVMDETKRGISQADSVRRLTFVAFIFIPLSFASSFFGMNIKQLGTGVLNIGYFFLLAFLAAGLSLILALSVKPLENAWGQARQRHALEEYQDENRDLIASITKREISSAYLKRHFPPARIISKEWDDTRGILADEFGGPYGDPDRVPVGRIIRFVCQKKTNNLAQILRLRKPSVAEPDPNTTT